MPQTEDAIDFLKQCLNMGATIEGISLATRIDPVLIQFWIKYGVPRHVLEWSEEQTPLQVESYRRLVAMMKK